jgi:hypothetical protein
MADLETFMRDVDQDHELDLIVDRLEQQFQDSIPEPELRGVARSQFAAFDRAPIREFVPVFVERRLRADLRARHP